MGEGQERLHTKKPPANLATGFFFPFPTLPPCSEYRTTVVSGSLRLVVTKPLSGLTRSLVLAGVKKEKKNGQYGSAYYVVSSLRRQQM